MTENLLLNRSDESWGILQIESLSSGAADRKAQLQTLERLLVQRTKEMTKYADRADPGFCDIVTFRR